MRTNVVWFRILKEAILDEDFVKVKEITSVWNFNSEKHWQHYQNLFPYLGAASMEMITMLIERIPMCDYALEWTIMGALSTSDFGKIQNPKKNSSQTLEIVSKLFRRVSNKSERLHKNILTRISYGGNSPEMVLWFIRKAKKANIDINLDIMNAACSAIKYGQYELMEKLISLADTRDYHYWENFTEAAMKVDNLELVKRFHAMPGGDNMDLVLSWMESGSVKTKYLEEYREIYLGDDYGSLALAIKERDPAAVDAIEMGELDDCKHIEYFKRLARRYYEELVF